MCAADSSPSNEPFKNWFNADRYRAIADRLAKACRKFDRDRFLTLTLTDLEQRALMDRLRQTAIAAEATLPGSYADKLDVLYQVSEGEEQGFIGIWFSEFAGRFGLKEPQRALEAMRHFTRYGSAEFAIRPYLVNAPDETLATLLSWTTDPNEHVRRLVSEGSRPRLPWGLRLDFLIKAPQKTRPILEALRDDPSLYVRKSVANHLNDIAKDHADYVVALVSPWDRKNPLTATLVKQGLRTLVKRGHPAALALMGAGAKPRIKVLRFTADPTCLQLGDQLALRLELEATGATSQTLIIDYVVHYVKANGATSAKVFKWRQLELDPRESFTAVKRQRIQDFTTRKHYPGEHLIELQINGQILAQTAFTLSR